MTPSVVFRADAVAATGTGHLMRCLALAGACVAGGLRATFLSRIEDPSLAAQVTGAGCELRTPGEDDARATSVAARGGWAVVDGYGFDAAYLARISAEARVAVIDDLAALPHYPVDLILNQNIEAAPERYRAKAGCRMLMGTSYALLRPEFAGHAHWRRPETTEARRLLVTLGGGDSAAPAARALEALAGARPGLEVRVLAGAGRGDAMLAAAALAARAAGHQVVLGGHAADMPTQMAEADLAVAAGGSTVWELAYMQVPSVLMALADNQRANVSGLARAGFALEIADTSGLGAAIDALRADRARRAAMARKGRELVDGQGAARVLEALRA